MTWILNNNNKDESDPLNILCRMPELQRLRVECFHQADVPNSAPANITTQVSHHHKTVYVCCSLTCRRQEGSCVRHTLLCKGKLWFCAQPIWYLAQCEVYDLKCLSSISDYCGRTDDEGCAFRSLIIDRTKLFLLQFQSEVPIACFKCC